MVDVDEDVCAEVLNEFIVIIVDDAGVCYFSPEILVVAGGAEVGGEGVLFFVSLYIDFSLFVFVLHLLKCFFVASCIWVELFCEGAVLQVQLIGGVAVVEVHGLIK